MRALDLTYAIVVQSSFTTNIFLRDLSRIHLLTLAPNSQASGGNSTLNPFLVRIFRLHNKHCILQTATSTPGARVLQFIPCSDRIANRLYTADEDEFVLIRARHLDNISSNTTHESWRRMLPADPPCLFKVDEGPYSSIFDGEHLKATNMDELMRSCKQRQAEVR